MVFFGALTYIREVSLHAQTRKSCNAVICDHTALAMAVIFNCTILNIVFICNHAILGTTVICDHTIVKVTVRCTQAILEHYIPYQVMLLYCQLLYYNRTEFLTICCYTTCHLRKYNDYF